MATLTQIILDVALGLVGTYWLVQGFTEPGDVRRMVRVRVGAALIAASVAGFVLQRLVA